ncbi:MAG: alpha-amylase family glycosyl hydrolase [Spirochaetaceae bacterium]
MDNLWYKESVFYHIYPLGFCGAPNENDYSKEPVERLYKICDWIPHLKSMGINALYLGPLFESQSHGYDTTDYYKVDQRLGTNQTLINVIKELHINGIKVVLDGVFNHVSRDFFGFKDLLKNRDNSIYKEWFTDIDFNNSSPYNDSFSYGCWSGHYNLPRLNLRNENVESHIFDAITMWVEEFNIDGLRLDVADVLDFDFMRELSTFTNTVKKDFWLMGEVIHGDYSNWVKPEILDSTTNYECYKGMFSSFNDNNFFEIAHSLKRLFDVESGVYKDLNLYNFIDNHDVNRIASTLKDKGHIFPLHILMYSIPGLPSIYYGSEWMIDGVKEGTSDSIVRPELDLDYMNNSNSSDLIDTISRLSHIWKKYPALKFGSYKEIQVNSEQIVFSREFDGEQILIVINSLHHPVTLEIDLDSSKIKVTDLLNSGFEKSIDDGQLMVEIPGCWGRILKTY